MADGVKINVSEMLAFSKAIGDVKTVERIYNNAFENMLEELAVLSKQNHEFESRTFLLEDSVFTEVKTNVGSVFVPSQIVSYAAAVYEGYGPFEMKPYGNENATALHPGYEGDPFILNNWMQFADKLTKDFLMDFVKQFNLYFKRKLA